MADSVEVAIVGGGQAGLAVSRALLDRDVEHLVLERSRVAETWRGRWDSFCLVTPNWTMALPGRPYEGDDPEGFVPRDDIVGYLERYASGFGVPVREGVEVHRLRAGTASRFALDTSDGPVHADTVVVCTGAYQSSHRPPVATDFPPSATVIDASEYHNPHQLPPGKVLVIGSGQTGCQLSEELHIDGRDVFLACGRAGWVPRRVDGRDIVTWLSETTFFDAPLASLASPKQRLGANLQATGRDGGHDLHYRSLQDMGIGLLGHLQGVEDGTAYFADDLADSVAFGDLRYAEIRQVIADQLPAQGITAPELPEPSLFRADPRETLDADDLAAVIFTTGFRPAYSSWVDFPAFDDMGFPVAEDGASAVVPGLYFCGVHFLRTRKSSLLFGVGEDAEVVAEQIARRR